MCTLVVQLSEVLTQFSCPAKSLIILKSLEYSCRLYSHISKIKEINKDIS